MAATTKFLHAGESLDDLCDGKHYIIQNRKLYCFTSDSVQLANFVKAKKTDTVVDLCSGSGIIGILINIRDNPAYTTLIELQESLSDMSKRTVEMNGLKNIKAINMKAQDACTILKKGEVSIVVVNPPYEKECSGEVSQNESIRIARSEEKIKLEEIVSVAKDLLKYGGYFYICLPCRRIFELTTLLHKYKFGIKETELQLDSKESARLVLLKAQSGGKDFVKIKTKKA